MTSRMIKYGLNGLNPYCSGQWSRTDLLTSKLWNSTSLNPYCSGQWSRTTTRQMTREATPGLNPYCSGQWSRTYYLW